jgi:glycosyltransferase involved in cell wall biosynthesis
MGWAIVASDTGPVREFIRHRRNGILTPFLDPKALADRILEMLEDKVLSARLRANARAYAERHLDLNDHLKAYTGLIQKLVNAG